MIMAILDSPVWEWITLGAVGVGLVAALTFVIRFQLEAGWDWWYSPFGRFLMTRKLLLTALFATVLINALTGRDWPGREAWTAILMVLFALQTFIPSRLLIKVRRRETSQEVRRDESRTDQRSEP